MSQANVIVIGGGPGGYVCAMKAALLGKKVILVEKDSLGGTCLNRGCIPTKALLHASETYKNITEAEKLGITASSVKLDYAKVESYKAGVVSTLTKGVGGLLRARKVTVVNGVAILSGKNTVDVKDASGKVTKYDADNIVIAAGSVPAVPPIPGVDGKNVITSNEALALKELPKSMVIIGGGVIGMEISTAFAEFGVKVTVIEVLPKVLATLDESISDGYAKLASKIMEIHTSAKVQKIADGKGGMKTVTYEENGASKTVDAEMVLVAVGRKPDTAALGLDKLGIKAERGRIQVNDDFMTNVPNIYAIGDANGKTMLAHVASAQGIAVAEKIAGHKCTIKQDIIPSCVYTHPEISSVGMSEKQAKEKGLKYKVGMFPLRGNGRSLVMGETDGFVKIIGDAETNEVLGVHIMGEYATEMIGECAQVMRLEGCVEDIAECIHAHPTVSESVMEAAEAYLGGAIHSI